MATEAGFIFQDYSHIFLRVTRSSVGQTMDNCRTFTNKQKCMAVVVRKQSDDKRKLIMKVIQQLILHRILVSWRICQCEATYSYPVIHF
jgi:hypothetical protein